MKKLAATLFVLFATSCRGGVVPPVPPVSSAQAVEQNALSPACGGRSPRAMPQSLTLSLSPGSTHRSFKICAEQTTVYKLSVSPRGIVGVPSTITPSAASPSGKREVVVPVRALHLGEATIAMRDASGHKVTVHVTVSLGRVYVAERELYGDVKVFNILNPAQNPTTIGPINGAEGLGVAMDRYAGRLYITEDFNGDVKVYDTNGCPYQIVASISGFKDPSGVAVDPVAQMLYVTELGDVKVYSTVNGQNTYVTTLGPAQGINVPGGLAVDPGAHKLYVAQGSNDVKIFNTSNLSQAPSTISGLSQPGGIAVDPATGKVYITENGTGDVRAYDESTNQYLGTIATGLNEPFGDAVDPITGKLYVVEYGSSDVKIFNTQDPKQSPSTISGVSDPWAVAIGP